MSPEQLPDVYQGDLDQSSYLALLEDLRALPQVEVSVKAGARSFVPERATISLDAAREALEAGEIRAVQVRYVFEGAIWIDTIVRTPGTLRLVRVQVHAGVPAAPGAGREPP